jgi:hypothetical protein
MKISAFKIFIFRAILRPLDSAVGGGRPTHPTDVPAIHTVTSINLKKYENEYYLSTT